MRVVVDANVLVSAVISTRGSPGEIVRLWKAGAFELVASPSILSEVQRVICYPKIQQRYNLPEKEVRTFLALLSSHTMVVEPARELSIISSDDPSDNQYLACATAGQAAYIVTGDHHLLDLRRYEGVDILSPAAFLAILRLEGKHKAL